MAVNINVVVLDVVIPVGVAGVSFIKVVTVVVGPIVMAVEVPLIKSFVLDVGLDIVVLIFVVGVAVNVLEIIVLNIGVICIFPDELVPDMDMLATAGIVSNV